MVGADGNGGGRGGTAERSGRVEAAVDAFYTRFDPALLTASEALEVVRRLAVLERKITAARANAPNDPPDTADMPAPPPLRRPAKAEVVVLVDGIALKRGHVGVGERCEVAGIGPGSTHNLNVLCTYHHHRKSRDGSRLERVEDHWHWYPPGHTQPWTSPIGPNLTLWDLGSGDAG